MTAYQTADGFARGSGFTIAVLVHFELDLLNLRQVEGDQNKVSRLQRTGWIVSNNSLSVSMVAGLTK